MNGGLTVAEGQEKGSENSKQVVSLRSLFLFLANDDMIIVNAI